MKKKLQAQSNYNYGYILFEQEGKNGI